MGDLRLCANRWGQMGMACRFVAGHARRACVWCRHGICLPLYHKSQYQIVTFPISIRSYRVWLNCYSYPQLRARCRICPKYPATKSLAGRQQFLFPPSVPSLVTSRQCNDRLSGLLLISQGWESKFLCDGLHLTPEGNLRAFEVIMETIRESHPGVAWVNIHTYKHRCRVSEHPHIQTQVSREWTSTHTNTGVAWVNIHTYKHMHTRAMCAHKWIHNASMHR